MTVTCWVGFALVNLDLLTTGFFSGEDDDQLTADYPVGFAVMNLLVLVLKLAGALVAALTVAPPLRPLPPPSVVGVSTYTAFITLGAFYGGSIAEGIDMIANGSGTLKELAYVGSFVLLIVCNGALGVSYVHRAGLRPVHVVVGVLGAVVLGGSITTAIAVLTALGLLPAS